MTKESKHQLTWLPTIATVSSILACHGTLLVVGWLSLAGISLTLNDTIWSASISILALLALGAIAVRNWSRNGIGPVVTAACGAGMVTWAMFVDYNQSVELAGFGALIAATIWDLIANRKSFCNSQNVDQH